MNNGTAKQVVVVTGAVQWAERPPMPSPNEAPASAARSRCAEDSMRPQRLEVIRRFGSSPVPTDVADSEPVEAAAEPSRNVSADRRVGERCDEQPSLRPLRPAKGVHPRNLGHLPGHGVRRDPATSSGWSRNPWRRRPGPLRTRLSRHPSFSRPIAAGISRSGFSPTGCRTELLHNKLIWISMVPQLPALNTPQFDWCRSKLQTTRNRSASTSRRCPPKRCTGRRTTADARSTVGGSAVKAIVGNKLSSRFADWFLARTGYASQQIADIDPDPPSTLSTGPSTGCDTRDVRRPGRSRGAISCGRHERAG